MTLRTLLRPARLGAAALLAAGGLAAVGAPAVAADPADRADLAIIPSSFQVAKSGKEAVAKPFKFTVVNSGPSAARDVTVTVDYSKLKLKLVDFAEPEGCATPRSKVFVCPLGQLLLNNGSDDVPAGARSEFGLPIWSVGGQGDAGKLVVRVASATADPDNTNNVADPAVTVLGAGYDLQAWALDVHVPVPVGGTAGAPASLDWLVYNAGSREAAGLTYILNLPAGAHFGTVPKECAKQAAALDVYYCQVPDLVLRPGEVYDAPVTVTVGAGATGKLPAPGQVAAEANGGAAAKAGARTAGRHRYGRAATAAERQQLADLDDGDNIANFDIYAELVTSSPTPQPTGTPTLGPSANPSQPGSPAPSGSPAAPGTGGGALPVTGVQAGMIVGVGVAVLALGALLFLLSRRRKVVLVAPHDERPDA
ncbi:LPXTG cell wall anchor domain-containing protein [Plantactinospora siamensis]|uniref:LPXTG cell wall anchor domain-containing protein n=1 Tax=Plantactinospora siamensis TaxID=555372 RepID=A0ABV6NTS4_9ACTN